MAAKKQDDVMTSVLQFCEKAMNEQDNAKKILNNLLQNYTTIPRQVEASKEELAVWSMREMLDMVEKDIKKELTASDEELIKQAETEWRSSIKILKKYFEER